jgi:hypothetical protein
MIYYHSSELGCGLGEARDLRAANAQVRRDLGSHHASAGYSVHKATVDEIRWVRAMGGPVPESADED